MSLLQENSGAELFMVDVESRRTLTDSSTEGPGGPELCDPSLHFPSTRNVS